MSGTRRVLLGGLVAVPAIAALPVTSAQAAPSSAFPEAWTAYQPYRDSSGIRGLSDAATDAWCDAQLAAAADLAEAPAGNLVELEAKLAAGLYWFDNSGAPSSMCDEEADLLRSCLADLRVIMARAAA
jgi:hypothetical protein